MNAREEERGTRRDNGRMEQRKKRQGKSEINVSDGKKENNERMQ